MCDLVRDTGHGVVLARLFAVVLAVWVVVLPGCTHRVPPDSVPSSPAVVGTVDAVRVTACAEDANYWMLHVDLDVTFTNVSRRSVHVTWDAPIGALRAARSAADADARRWDVEHTFTFYDIPGVERPAARRLAPGAHTKRIIGMFGFASVSPESLFSPGQHYHVETLFYLDPAANPHHPRALRFELDVPGRPANCR